MSKHTPGPWEAKVIDTIYGEPAYWHIVQTSKNGVIGDVQSANFADARLIAAAPDLLYIASWIEKECEEGDGTIPDGLYNAARAAIKKATGA